MRSEIYQYSLIGLGVAATALFGVFFLREVFPEYKIYQEDYVALEKFRSTYTGEPPPAFSLGVKQILLEREDKGNPVIDRCISCHVALQFPHFSPTKIAYDVNGVPMVDAQGNPRLIPNENYIWGKLNAKIASLTDEKVNSQLIEKGDNSVVKKRLSEAENLKALKVAHVGDHAYDVTKVLAMHPLIGKETRPFEFHPIEEYGCSSCHSGNGRGLTTQKAHGPVFDDEYEKEDVGHVPHFTEQDPDNDPAFGRIFNGKPGHELLFQTSPILVGALIQSKCVQCHQTSGKALEKAVDSASLIAEKRQKQINGLEKSFQSDSQALISLLNLDVSTKQKGLPDTIKEINIKLQDYTLPAQVHEQLSNQLKFLKNIQKSANANEIIDENIAFFIGTPALVQELKNTWQPLENENTTKQKDVLNTFLKMQRTSKDASGILFAKLTTIDLNNQIMSHLKEVTNSLGDTVSDSKTNSAIASDVDLLTYNYQRGQRLYVSQACYACHRISGFARGGIGPELTTSGNTYPWYLKESIVWPQADLKTSTMPNYGLDHEELEDLVTFLMGQFDGNSKVVSNTDYKIAIQEWESGRKLGWEKPLTPLQIRDLRYSMTVFVTEGCAACHRLKGFESNVGYSIEKDKPSFDALYTEKEWFKRLFPEEITGSAVVKVIENNESEIDKRIVDNVRKDSILEEIEIASPQTIEALYTPFKFANRAKNAEFRKRIEHEKDPEVKEKLAAELQTWKDRIHRLMMVFAQEYGVGRIIGPRPNWSGVYHTDEWLMEHFRNPASHVPRSIMPVFPFDDSKFYALTHMLNVLGVRNRDSDRQIWENRGFNPELAFEMYCSQCHGPFLHGNGPVSNWIYPIPKNLHNVDFLRNLTRDRAIDSIIHGVKGTPMPPWGEAPKKNDSDDIPVLTKNEITKLVDWLYSSLPSSQYGEEVQKWKYSPQDVIHELENEGTLQELLPNTNDKEPMHSSASGNTALKIAFKDLPKGDDLYAALTTQMPLKSKPDSNVSEIFNVIPNPYSGPEKELYYIKQKYYTPENIEQGRLFFEMNCAVCHGKDADGSGMRAGTMIEAKPRMLTNLDWIKTRDDLRLLRSIKYGVAGTSMTPWGDFTSSLQRMQLVIFIRSLSSERGLQDNLAEAIFTAFDNTDLLIEHSRIEQYATLDSALTLFRQLKGNREKLYQYDAQESDSSRKALDAYQLELEQMGKLSQLQSNDALYSDLRKQIKAEKEIYQSLGAFILQTGNRQDLDDYIKLIEMLDNRFQDKEGKLVYQFSDLNEANIVKHGQGLIKSISTQLDQLKQDQTILEGKMSSANRNQALHELDARIKATEQLKNRLVSTLAEGIRLRQKEKVLVEEISLKQTSKPNGKDA
ncbi:MAG: c-type cytochrome [Parachlamydiaceae bacterium]|nr:c-type cytochrome [Parachlamydiaceae bacterium]